MFRFLGGDTRHSVDKVQQYRFSNTVDHTVRRLSLITKVSCRKEPKQASLFILGLAFGLQKGQGLWTPQNLASDVIIGLVDTGIWPEHQSFQDTGLSAVPSRWKGTCRNYKSFRASCCNRKLIGAAVFLKGYEEGTGTRINDTTEYRSPRDSEGHGTHTASTAGGVPVFNANISGMAIGTAVGMRPTARIAVYKVCFEEGCADSDIFLSISAAVKSLIGG